MRNILLVLLGFGFIFADVAEAAKPMRFQAQLAGFDLDGNPVDTAATGFAMVEVIGDDAALEFKVNVTGIDKLLMAHIHVLPGADPVKLDGPAGPIAFWFTGALPPSPLAETLNGRLAQGYLINNGQLFLNPPQSFPPPPVMTIAELIQAIEGGRASVIVHTGDSPGGELRGTLE